MSKTENTIRVGIDVASLSDKALTGIPLYIESLLREYFSSNEGDEEWVLVGSQKGTDLKSLLQERGISIDKRSKPAEVVPAVDFRIASNLPTLEKVPGSDWLIRKVDGRLLWSLGNVATSNKLPPVDVMHHTATLRIAPRRARKNIVTIYDLTTRFFPETHGRVNIVSWERVFDYAKNSADLVIADSESAKQDIIEQLGISAERVAAIPLGVRPLPTNIAGERLTEIRQKFGLAEKRFVLAAGTLEPRKNLPRLIEAFAALHKAPEYSDVLLVLTGARKHGTNAVEEAIQTHGIADHTVLTGYATDEELAALMKTCACFIYPSVYEGFGLPVAEAMALGAPVATSNVSSMPEVAGDAAILFDPKSVEAIADAMRAILSDTLLAADLRTRGVVRAANFSWKRCADEHRRLYHEVIGG